MREKIIDIGTSLLVFLFGFVLFLHPLSAFTQDLGRHLKTGEIIVTTGTVPKTNLFSYTNTTFPFSNHHWFSEVIFYLISHNLGLYWLLVCIACVGGVSFLILYLQTINMSKYNVISLFVVFLFGGILLQRLDLRPEIFSFFCTTVFVSVLYRFREKPTKWIFLLPLLEVFWANVHIYFIIGPLLIGLFLIENWIQQIYTTKKITLQQFFARKHLLLYIVILLLTVLATLFNPNTLQGALYPFTVFSNYGYSIEENQSLFTLLNLGFSQSSFLFFFFAVLLLFFTLLLNWKRSQLIDWLLASIFTIIAFSAVRNFSLFVFTLYIPLATNLHCLIKHIVTPKKLPKLLGLFVCIAFGGWILMNAIGANGFGFGIPAGAEPGVDFLISHHLPARLFNNFDIGSYLEYRLYPKEEVFVDGRPEAYPASFFQNTYIPMQQNPNIFAQVDAKYHFQTIFFSYTDQTPWAQTFLMSLAQNPQWSLVYVDGFSAIWVKNTLQNTSIINHFNLQQNKFPIFPIQTTAEDYLHLAYFFSLIHWQQPKTAALEKLVQIDPTNCQALQELAQNSQNHMLYTQNYLAHCQ